MREYETVYILRPELTTEELEAFNLKLKGIVTDSGGKILRLTVWGKKKLAYKLKKCSRGIYIHLLYLDNGKAVAELERNLRISDNAIRFLTVLINRDVDPTTRQAEADVKMRGDAEDENPAGPAPAEAPLKQVSEEKIESESAEDDINPVSNS